MRPFLAAAVLAALAAPAFAQSGLLGKYDTNGDGALSLEEFRGAQADRFAAADADGDGRLTAAELRARGGSRLAAIDADGDGAVSKSEFLAQSAGFDRADRDGDGVLDGQEAARLDRALAGAKG
mgnify:CR=1 FL=1